MVTESDDTIDGIPVIHFRGDTGQTRDPALRARREGKFSLLFVASFTAAIVLSVLAIAAATLAATLAPGAHSQTTVIATILTIVVMLFTAAAFAWIAVVIANVRDTAIYNHRKLHHSILNLADAVEQMRIDRTDFQARLPDMIAELVQECYSIGRLAQPEPPAPMNGAQVRVIPGTRR